YPRHQIRAPHSARLGIRENVHHLAISIGQNVKFNETKVRVSILSGGHCSLSNQKGQYFGFAIINCIRQMTPNKPHLECSSKTILHLFYASYCKRTSVI